MATYDVHAPTLGTHGEPCAVCGAPLAADQRYCLTCGARRAETRLAFRSHLPAAAAATWTAEPSVATARPAGEPAAASRGPLAVVAGVGCLLLALGIGVLIGQAGDTPRAASSTPPQVISVGAAAAPAPTTADGGATGAGSGSAATGDSGAAAGTKKKSGKAAQKSTGDRGAAAAQLDKLQKLSPDQYQKQSQKLPKQVGTGGKPAPVSAAEKKKPAGGGTGFQDIG